MRRPTRLTLGLLVTSTLGAAIACNAQVAEAHGPVVERPYVQPYVSQDISIALESPSSAGLASYWYSGALYVEGRMGERYNVRVTNHTAGRVEAVVTVDGRDVLTGDLGDYRKQRGYVIEPYGSVVIEGYRQSLDYVAAFRFADVRDSYSSLRGTPQHVGVVGVAVFKEHVPRRWGRAPQPVAPPRPYYEPYGGGGGRAEARAAAADEAAPSSTPSAAARKSSRDAYGGDYGGYAPPPRQNRLGTEYGETTWSSVREVSFKRESNRRPDYLLTVYYDSREGLRARGVPVDPPPPPPVYYPPYDPQPFPDNRYAPPPPRRY